MKYRITVFPNGFSFPCDQDESVLAAMLRNRMGPVVCGCCGGGCGICKMKIISGNFYPFKKMSRAHLSEEEANQGYQLLCCIKPQSDMVITRE